MKNQAILLSLLASLTASGCQQIECADGTIERDGQCEPASAIGDPAKCGDFTELVGDRCVPVFPPTECGDNTTASVDQNTGVTTCVGEGGIPACGVAITCKAPSSASQQSICGQLYDFETGMRFEAGGEPVKCTTPTADGPCALAVNAYNAVMFAGGGGGAPTPLTPGEIYLDSCGRFKLLDIDAGAAGPFTGIGVDDASGLGPTGIAVTAAVTAQTRANMIIDNVEAFIVKPSTVTSWSQTAEANLLQSGIYAPVYRKHKPGNPAGDVYPAPNQDGVQVTKLGTNAGVNDFYFQMAQTTRTSIDTNADETGVNGTALVTNGDFGATLGYSGTGGLGAGCRWSSHSAASIPGIVFIQILRKQDVTGMTCND